MNIVEEYYSPDRFLRLIVTRDDGGDISIGFDGYAWHTHGEILASTYGLPEKEAIQEFVRQMIRDDQIIVVSRVNGQVRDVWPTSDANSELRHKPPGESLEFRRWSGLILQVSPG